MEEAFSHNQSHPRVVTTSFKRTHMARMAGGACVQIQKEHTEVPLP
jgi:hypothetical protein